MGKPDELVIHDITTNEGLVLEGPWELKQVPEPPCGELVFVRNNDRVPWHSVREYVVADTTNG
jgi:hypothetical protein